MSQTYDRYYFAGTCGIKRCCSVAAAISDNTFNCCDSTNKYNAQGADEDPHVFIQEEPIGMGGQSGSSSDNGLNGQTEQITVHTCMYRTCGYTGGGGSTNCHEMNYVVTVLVDMTIVLVGINIIAIVLDIGLDVFQLVHRGKEIVLETNK